MAARERALRHREQILREESATLSQSRSCLGTNYQRLRDSVEQIASNAHLNSVFDEIKGLRQDICRLEYAEKYLCHLIAVEEASLLLDPGQSDIHKVISGLEALQRLHDQVSYSPTLNTRINHILSTAKSAHLEHCMSRLTAAATACQWPSPIAVERWDEPAVIEFAEAAAALVRLRDALGEDGRRALVKVLLGPVAIRFAFHFDTMSASTEDVPSGAEDRPEWFLKFLERVAREHADFLVGYLEQMLSIGPSGHRPLLDLFIDELVTLAKTKLFKLRSKLLQSPLLLSQAVGNVAAFYRRLRDDFGYEDEGRACLALFTQDDEVMNLWLSNELAAINVSLDRLPIPPYETFIAKSIDLFDAVTLLYRDLEDCALQSLFFCRLQVHLLERVYKAVEFSLPVFHSTPEDLALFIQAANQLDALLEVVRGRWATDLFFIELAHAPELQKAIGYDPTQLPGGVFAKTISAFSDLLNNKIISEHIGGFVTGQFLNHASAYAKAMHYGITRQPGESIDMHPGLQKGMIALGNGLSSLKASALLPHLMKPVEAQTIAFLETFFFNKVILKNYFHSMGIQAFARDLQTCIAQASQMMNSQDTLNAFAKSKDAVRFMQLPPDRLQVVRSSQEDPLSFTSQYKRLLPDSRLSADEVGELLRLIKL